MLKAAVIGNLGNDPELRYTPTGQALLQMNVASNYRVRSQAGEWTDKVEWVRVTVFGNRAESLSNLLKKGMRIFADGRLEARPWTSREGELRAGLEMVANDVDFMSPRQEDGYPHPTNTANAPAQRPAAARASGDDDDLVPF